MAKVQKVYTKEFKEQAVHLAQTSGKPIKHRVMRSHGFKTVSYQGINYPSMLFLLTYGIRRNWIAPVRVGFTSINCREMSAQE
ncbi:hypothetical protein Krac_7002 [Ktedonobacter racemifer DSM 44963]|uniref:Transposase n=1 Tax=Ktedonobacter racemifer DSM 44963 TaxID=485913 RepID=D6TQB8_KTERA|nr:hypothetical protein Krac_7002 [Ktedonobacter racemifer DSM 44963]